MIRKITVKYNFSLELNIYVTFINCSLINLVLISIVVLNTFFEFHFSLLKTLIFWSFNNYMISYELRKIYYFLYNFLSNLLVFSPSLSRETNFSMIFCLTENKFVIRRLKIFQTFEPALAL